jgi:peptidoglycan/LPS O-acetylase OafA/YrhL
MRAGERDTPRPRRVEIDLLKGCAILWVLLIHSKALGDSIGFLYLVNRAVPLFVILFGLNATLWWRGRALPDQLAVWFATRIKRILVPFWASLPLWWALVFWYRPVDVAVHWWVPLVQIFGYAVYIGTGWFVTLILLMVVLFPLLEAAVRRIGIWPVLLVAVAGELFVAHEGAALIGRFGWLNFLVFPPRLLGHVVFGMLLATRIERIGPIAGAACAVLWALCVVACRSSRWPELAAYGGVVIDFPLAVALLAGLRPLAALPVVAPALAWLGVSSWGLYLGQMLVHNLVIYRCGFRPDLAPNLARCRFPFAGQGGALHPDRWLYTLVLLVGAIGFVWLGGRVLRSYGALRRAGISLPDLGR